MRLDHSNLLPYLLGRSWLDAEAVVAGDAVVFERRLRHTSFVVEQSGGRGVFVKQLHDPHPEAAATLRREAAFYRAVAAGRLGGLSAVVPGFVGYDHDEHVLALTRFDGLSAQDRAVAGRPMEAAEAAVLGAALAVAHGVPARTARSVLAGAVTEALPWAFHLARRLAEDTTTIPGAGTAFLGLLNGRPQLVEWMAGLAAWWQPGALIHGDLKWENVLLSGPGPRPGGDPGRGVRLIDWELASMGDRAWDVATHLQAALVRTCLERGREHPLDPAEPIAHRAAQQAFLRAWSSALPIADPSWETRRILAFTAVRLVYTAYEHAVISPRLHPAILAMVATAWRMLGDARYAEGLVGLDA